MAKKTNFIPAPIDADGDGIVQEGTEFERPAEPVITEWLETPIKVERPATSHVVAEGENWQSIAALYCGTERRQDYARRLFAANLIGDLHVGAVLKLV